MDCAVMSRLFVVLVAMFCIQIDHTQCLPAGQRSKNKIIDVIFQNSSPPGKCVNSCALMPTICNQATDRCEFLEEPICEYVCVDKSLSKSDIAYRKKQVSRNRNRNNFPVLSLVPSDFSQLFDGSAFRDTPMARR